MRKVNGSQSQGGRAVSARGSSGVLKMEVGGGVGAVGGSTVSCVKSADGAETYESSLRAERTAQTSSAEIGEVRSSGEMV